LRDDLDEGPIGEASIESGAEPEETATGGVIDYEGEFGKEAPFQRPQRDKHGRGKRRPRSGGRREELESRPRESFGKKRGGKRVFSPQEQGRGAAGEKGGNFRFRPKHKKRRFKSFAADNQRRGERRGQKQEKTFSKGRKRKGRR